MALIKCPECGHEVSDTAVSCPNCGYVLKRDEPTTSSSEDIVTTAPSGSGKQGPSKKIIGIIAAVTTVVVIVAIAALSQLESVPAPKGKWYEFGNLVQQDGQTIEDKLKHAYGQGRVFGDFSEPNYFLDANPADGSTIDGPMDTNGGIIITVADAHTMNGREPTFADAYDQSDDITLMYYTDINVEEDGDWISIIKEFQRSCCLSDVVGDADITNDYGDRTVQRTGKLSRNGVAYVWQVFICPDSQGGYMLATSIWPLRDKTYEEVANPNV